MALPRTGQCNWRTGVRPWHHDNRYPSKTVAVEFEAGGKVDQAGRFNQRRRHDLSQYGNDALLPDYRCCRRPDLPHEAMRGAVNDSFNMVCVDGDMSTNDSAFIFANGRAGNDPLNVRDGRAETFVTALRYVTRYLGPRDGARRRGRNQIDDRQFITGPAMLMLVPRPVPSPTRRSGSAP